MKVLFNSKEHVEVPVDTSSGHHSALVTDCIVFQDENGEIFLGGYAKFSSPKSLLIFFGMDPDWEEYLARVWADEEAVRDYLYADDTLVSIGGSYYYPVVYRLFSPLAGRRGAGAVLEETGEAAEKMLKELESWEKLA